jgi:hypothetical protein
MCPSVPAGRPRYSASGAWAASSITIRPCSAAIAMIASMSAGRPKMSTATIAFVRGVMRARIESGSRLNVSGSMSANTGVAPCTSAHVAEALIV